MMTNDELAVFGDIVEELKLINKNLNLIATELPRIQEAILDTDKPIKKEEPFNIVDYINKVVPQQQLSNNHFAQPTIESRPVFAADQEVISEPKITLEK